VPGAHGKVYVACKLLQVGLQRVLGLLMCACKDCPVPHEVCKKAWCACMRVLLGTVGSCQAAAVCECVCHC